ncbi:hypothetical protein N581_06800 [Lactobacillus jensenii MD IIE-70(2)]|nr:hypothetical protein N581_06800 [Lactobacillus jensenii MD IIE-70(2)]
MWTFLKFFQTPVGYLIGMAILVILQYVYEWIRDER